MTTVIGILCFTLVIFTNPVELVYPHSSSAIHPDPIEVYNVHHYENMVHPDHQGPTSELLPGFYRMGTDERHEYIIGVYLPTFGTLDPLMARRADLGNELGCVRIRIDGNIANVTSPWSRNDRQFRMFLPPEQVVAANVHGPAIGLPIF